MVRVRPSSLQPLPVFLQFGSVNLRPGFDEASLAMLGCGFSKHADDDPKEPGDLGHAFRLLMRLREPMPRLYTGRR